MFEESFPLSPVPDNVSIVKSKGMDLTALFVARSMSVTFFFIVAKFSEVITDS